MRDQDMKDMLSQEDDKFVAKVNKAIVAAQSEATPGGITRADVKEALQRIPEIEARKQASLIMVNQHDVDEARRQHNVELCAPQFICKAIGKYTPPAKTE